MDYVNSRRAVLGPGVPGKYSHPPWMLPDSHPHQSTVNSILQYSVQVNTSIGTPTLTPTPIRAQWTPYSSTAYRWIQIYWYFHTHSHPHEDTVNSILQYSLQVNTNILVLPHSLKPPSVQCTVLMLLKETVLPHSLPPPSGHSELHSLVLTTGDCSLCSAIPR